MTLYWGSTIYALISIVVLVLVIVGIVYIVRFIRKMNQALDIYLKNEKKRKVDHHE